MSFPEQLKKARLNMKYTQQQVANLMGINKSTYCGYETGKRQPDVRKIQQLATVLHTSGDTLLETGYSETVVVRPMTAYETDLLKKYRALDEHGKEIVNIVLSKEYERAFSYHRPVTLVARGGKTVDGTPDGEIDPEKVKAAEKSLKSEYDI